MNEVRETDYDVIILGGAFAGAAAGVLFRRERADTRVLVIEKSEEFDRKVGEATTEMSAMFLTRRLALWQHLERAHLPKEGLRYWFGNERVSSHDDAGEVGGIVRSPVPSFQLRRDALDEHLIELASREGCDIARPARAQSVSSEEKGRQVVRFMTGSDERTVTARWVIDATGRSSLLGRSRKLIKSNDDHPIGAMWARWTGVRHIDDIAARAGSKLAERNVGSRRLGTNHYMGYGHWIWVIPLESGETSIGLVYDPRRFDARTGSPAEIYAKALHAHAPLSELIREAEMREDDFRSLRNLAYRPDQYMGDGWALIGDAAAFIDPYYSPGLDHAAFSIDATVRIVSCALDGEDVDDQVAEHNETFLRSYDRFFESVYRDKYEYMGELDLLTASFLLETAQYYIFVVIPAYKLFRRFHWMPVLGPRPAFISYHLMRICNRRLGKIARLRREAGEAGAKNDRRRINAYFNLGFAPFRMAVRGLRLWAMAEIDSLRLYMKRLGRKPEAEEEESAKVEEATLRS